MDKAAYVIAAKTLGDRIARISMETWARLFSTGGTIEEANQKLGEILLSWDSLPPNPNDPRLPSSYTPFEGHSEEVQLEGVLTKYEF